VLGSQLWSETVDIAHLQSEPKMSGDSLTTKSLTDLTSACDDSMAEVLFFGFVNDLAEFAITVALFKFD
jgi:hypothetical protein